MKKILILFITIGFLSCGASKTVRESKKTIKGNWTLNSISTSAIGDIKVSLLNDANKDCFEKSTWQFIPNNNTGNYTLSGTGCDQDQRYFVFTIDEIDETSGLYHFLLKPTNSKGKSETNTGFRLQLTALSDTDMQWQQIANLDGKPVTITMNFKKL
ncbi:MULTISPECIES: lipocalin family protein [Winogradskyella]|uniref:Lipocalin n=1 Tax=Winogradskyella ouciana TaxID=2608631 RepID=A0A7K1GAL1_9FLAO|nr:MULTISPECIES: lipocalin family protein [Winogradskyella]MBO6880003.1 lipocalin family protein [Winogradskyella sp.]MTE26171.1 lipocalin [Winogradskyella ouciana]